MEEKNEILAEEVEKLGYTPKGEYNSSAEYVYGDVVFYNYKLYAMIARLLLIASPRVWVFFFIMKLSFP